MEPREPELPAPLEPPLESMVRRLAAAEPLEPHPAAAALQSYDEEPGTLSPRTRQWIESHLAACCACRDALRAVPRLELRSRPMGRRLWPLAAAAGWILAGFLGLRALDPGRDEREPFLAVHTLVLSTPRGGEIPAVPAGARALRLELVLGEEVPLGASLHVRIEDAEGRAVVEEDRAVEERNERDWPVLTLDREALPRGTVKLRVRTPSGLESVFELEL
jgi:hypothetical protein